MLMSSHDPFQPRRQLCSRCQRVQTACICHWISPIDHLFDVLILQHPLEAGSAKNSARLLHLSLPHSKLAVGEIFDPAELHALLHAPSMLPSGAGIELPVQPVLLYTEDAGTPASSRFDARTMSIDGQPPEQRLRLVILDGTWRKSRKMLHENPLLHALPRLALQDTPLSQYVIRKAHKPEQLSTLEAAGYALMQLEKNSEKYHPLLTAFDGFVLQQTQLRSRGQASRCGD
ncbi:MULTISPECIES: tRNA-uridine aminocarboxypropyltransferase [unclassified Herbaspirillum]|uniref:tRNA-uridine aminocarboxypropyltransferase n=1 Tax=unclassified Herbaspirillum TaxID=2624150 RepID=UPI0011514AD9|nr:MULTISPECIES: tRNA-uridine aminocarboxypropyltransferase [unclassified Herbaspirillum]MBB5391703.1 DTW domain-containing protein YfiP [Herbaspirillum sp. SJZ102]TQK03050.1 DTW domain-containing protein YfiP [Herbaspirillum sp. SJZ130]TQK06562.1 DTW domain-containing protein YfiP [Herbaspirillum sp. SJZ106]